MNNIQTLLREQKAQTGMEYLLLIAGAVLVVAVVSIVLKNTANQAGQEVTAQATQPVN